MTLNVNLQLITELVTPSLDQSRAFGFLGPGPIGPHIAHALGFVDALVRVRPDLTEPGRSFVDLGAGGGLPGLVAALALPLSTWLYLDVNVRRTGFLATCAEELGIADRVEIRCERAELTGQSPTYRGRFDGVVARGFAGPPVTAECGAPLLSVGGLFVVSEPPDAGDRWPAEGIAQVGLTKVSAVDVGHRFFVARKFDETPSKFPRRVGIPEKRPLF
jgi:16S rRNA (guanine527-N7)-methyltransferase